MFMYGVKGQNSTKQEYKLPRDILNNMLKPDCAARLRGQSLEVIDMNSRTIKFQHRLTGRGDISVLLAPIK